MSDRRVGLGYIGCARWARSLAVGYGVAEGKSRLALVADLPRESGQDYLPTVRNSLDARAAGEPDALFQFSIPTAQEFARLEESILGSMAEADRPAWHEAKDEFTASIGVSIEEILAAVGPEVMLIFDSAGDYGAIRMRDEALWNSIVKRISHRAGSSPERSV